MNRLGAVLAGILLCVNVGSADINTEKQAKEPLGKIFLTNQLAKLLHETPEEKEAERLATKMWGDGAVKRSIVEELNKLANKLQSEGYSIKHEWLIFTIHSESRGKAWIRNTHSDATGIIQWLPSTARALGTSVRKLRKMSVVEQIPYIEKYLKVNGILQHIESYSDLYLGVFSPRSLKGSKKDNTKDFVIGSKGSKAYDWNAVVDTHYGNNDGKLTVQDFERFAMRDLKLDNS